MKKVSVIVPCHNASAYLDRCLKSLKDQTIGIENLEIILIDDASTDDTGEKLKAWEERIPDSIRVTAFSENKLQGAARNYGIGIAEGDYIAFLDADDWLLPMALEHIYNKAVKSGAEITGYFSRNASSYSADDLDFLMEGRSRLLKLGGTGDFIELFFTGITMRGCWDKMYKKSFVVKNGFRFAEGVFDEESLFTIPAFLAANKYYLLFEELHRYYENHTSTVYNLIRNKEHRDDNIKTWSELYGFLSDGGYLKREPEVIEALFIQNYFNRSFLHNIPRGVEYDAETVSFMQSFIRERFPGYENNPILTQMRSLRYTKALMDYPVNNENLQGFYEILREFEENVGNEL